VFGPAARLITINTANGQVTNRGTGPNRLDAVEFGCSPFPTDLAISKTGPADAAASSRATYTIVVTNRGPAVADQLIVTDTLPEGTSLVSASLSGGTCSSTSREVTCRLDLLAVGDSATMSVTIDTGNSESGPMVNTATVRSATRDTNLANNTATFRTGSPVVSAVNEPNNDDHEDEDVKDKKESEDQRRQRERTNASNRDDYVTEGNVVEVHQDEQRPYVVIANRDGLVTVMLLCGNQCPTIRVGDYLEADGEKQHEFLFEAESVTITRNGRGR
jgi:uncharacterized repeat protein (TIGR01451 family)